jgi:hypothetical protein
MSFSTFNRYSSGQQQPNRLGSEQDFINSIYHSLNGGAGTSFYVKESCTGNTGWAAK